MNRARLIMTDRPTRIAFNRNELRYYIMVEDGGPFLWFNTNQLGGSRAVPVGFCRCHRAIGFSDHSTRYKRLLYGEGDSYGITRPPVIGETSGPPAIGAPG